MGSVYEWGLCCGRLSDLVRRHGPKRNEGGSILVRHSRFVWEVEKGIGMMSVGVLAFDPWSGLYIKVKQTRQSKVICWACEMSSLSLPRVLQPRKTSLEQERENFEKFQVGYSCQALLIPSLMSSRKAWSSLSTEINKETTHTAVNVKSSPRCWLSSE